MYSRDVDGDYFRSVVFGKIDGEAVRRAAAAVVRGLNYYNEYTPFVIEFLEKKKLAELGYTFPGKELSLYKARIFCEIALKFELIKSEEMKKAVKGGKRR